MALLALRVFHLRDLHRPAQLPVWVNFIMALSEDITQRKDGSSIWIRNNVSLVPGTERVPRSNWALFTELLQGKRRQF